MPMASGSPICTGAPCTDGNLDVTWTVFTTLSLGMGLMETTIGPENTPAGVVGISVMYIDTLVSRSM